MRVLFWSETFWPRIGGVERLATALLPALRERGHEFAVVTWVDGEPAGSADFRGIGVHRFRFFAGTRHEGALGALKHVEEVRRLKRRFDPHLVHVNSCGRSAWFHLATDDRRTPTLVTVHQPVPADLDPVASVAGRLLATASWTACCSHAVLATVQERFVPDKARASVIGNALPDPAPEPAPARFDAPRLLFVGRLVPEKGLDAVLEALPWLFARHPRARLVIAGDGPQARPLRAAAAAAGIAAQVEFLGEVEPERVRVLIEESAVVIVPSRVEGFGLVALEAAAGGRSVVATRVGGLPEVVDDGITGVLVEPGDSQRFVRAVDALLADPARADRLGRAARESAMHRFDWAQHVDAYDRLYRRLAA